MVWTLAVSAAATLAAGLLFVRVGATLRARALASDADARAMRSFSMWWIGVGASTVFLAGMLAAGLAAEPSPMLVAGLRILSLAALTGGLTGLLSHITYVYTGRDRTRVITAAYGLLGATVIGFILWSQPAFVDVTGWTVETRGARPVHPLMIPVFILAYLVPPIVAGGMYLRLVRRASDAAQRQRILTVGGGILVWASANLLARANDADLWQFLTRALLGVVVALLVARAYAAPPQERAVASDDRFMERVRQLV